MTQPWCCWFELVGGFDFKLRGGGGGVDVGVVVLVDARLKGVGVDGVLGAQAEGQRDGLVGAERIEVQDGLRRGLGEFFQTPAGEEADFSW
jgi:hypothetical protein